MHSIPPAGFSEMTRKILEQPEPPLVSSGSSGFLPKLGKRKSKEREFFFT